MTYKLTIEASSFAELQVKLKDALAPSVASHDTAEEPQKKKSKKTNLLEMPEGMKDVSPAEKVTAIRPEETQSEQALETTTEITYKEISDATMAIVKAPGKGKAAAITLIKKFNPDAKSAQDLPKEKYAEFLEQAKKELVA